MCVEMWMCSAEWCKIGSGCERMGCRRLGKGAGRPVRRLLQSYRPEMMFSWTRMLPEDLEDVHEFRSMLELELRSPGEQE